MTQSTHNAVSSNVGFGYGNIRNKPRFQHWSQIPW